MLVNMIMLMITYALSIALEIIGGVLCILAHW